MTLTAALPDDLGDLLVPYLTRQRWYAGPPTLGPGDIAVVETQELCSTGDGSHHLYVAMVEVAGSRYQVLVGERPAGEHAEFLQGHGDSVIAGLDDRYLYDATVDPELSRQLLPIVTGGVEAATRVRPVGAEQSNTSLVYDDRIIVKVFRRLVEGRNPDIEVTSALHRVGFTHVARPYGVWRLDDYDLGFAQEFLAGGSEGWALALTSLRDFYNSGLDDPAGAGGDFSMEARRLGAVTAQLHLAMAAAFGEDRERLRNGQYAALVSSVRERLLRVGADGSLPPERVEAAVGRIAEVGDPGPAVRVHGDYHLGQVMRADGGWYVIDFEGEPARPVEERLEPASPFKDVAGMLRSLDYAARFGLQERGGVDGEGLAGAAASWAAHNGAAFVDGYLGQDGVERLLPAAGDREAVLAAYELDKALYELDYERAYRPAWEPIPRAAIARITDRLVG